jgi:hypothetical protein
LAADWALTAVNTDMENPIRLIQAGTQEAIYYYRDKFLVVIDLK